MYWAHCRDCGDHFDTKTGYCHSCRSAENTMGCDEGAEKGCADCAEIERTESSLAKARLTIVRGQQP